MAESKAAFVWLLAGLLSSMDLTLLSFIPNIMYLSFLVSSQVWNFSRNVSQKVALTNHRRYCRACDLSSISVLPPHCRPSNVPLRPQLLQIQSQQHSQHSFSQGFSSQQGICSQLSQSQNPLDDGLINDQHLTLPLMIDILRELKLLTIIFTAEVWFSERESTAMKNSSVPPMSHSKDGNHMPISAYSTNCMRKWGPAASSESRCQVSEDLEHKLDHWKLP
ncbi:hypothetical protein MLD38_023467 [Melastoma candidum]|uniref:Uncharacterized protein n=1 Tax=Melastoma candidum TaxID=119954 RepID=A0ACB9NQN4_9MYRT|nr:hypothetical protein MLD38_023467 [Melastoma candidum]